jgi:hypothetical protein
MILAAGETSQRFIGTASGETPHLSAMAMSRKDNGLSGHGETRKGRDALP